MPQLSPMPVSTEKVFDAALDAISREVHGLSDTIHQLLLRYSLVVNDLNQCRSENRQMAKELEVLRARQNIIIGQMNRQLTVTSEDLAEKSTIN